MDGGGGGGWRGGCEVGGCVRCGYGREEEEREEREEKWGERAEMIQ